MAQKLKTTVKNSKSFKNKTKYYKNMYFSAKLNKYSIKYNIFKNNK